MPLEALSFMPTMFGWAARRPTRVGLRVMPQKPGALYRSRGIRAPSARGVVAVQDFVGHLLRK